MKTLFFVWFDFWIYVFDWWLVMVLERNEIGENTKKKKKKKTIKKNPIKK